MRRLLLLILWLCSMWAAQGQVAYDWRYWIDQSQTYEQGKNEGPLHLDVDVSGLSKTLHQFHIQVRDTAGMFSEPVTRYFIIPDDSHGNGSLHYWFDQNNAALKTMDAVSGMFDLDVSSLTAGFHTLHLFVNNDIGEQSDPIHKGFIKTANSQDLTWRYWFDDDENKSVTMPTGVTSLMIDVDSLSDGIHYIHFQAMNERFSEARTQMFIKVPRTANLDKMFCLILVDNILLSKETIDMKNGGMASINLDVNSLSQGLHKLDVMVMTPGGSLSNAYNSFFIREYKTDERGALRCLYAFDEESELHEAYYSEGLSHINIDVAHLEDGPHTIRWMLQNKEGAFATARRSWFLKQPLGGNAISKYNYWLNDADSIKHETVLAEPRTPYDLIALLPVETMPLRSSCFQFEVKDGKPILYAKNDLHIAFADKFGRETNISKQFVDYGVSEDVTEIEELQPTQTFARVEENGIKWFNFEAAPGDTIAFRNSQATSLQVFAPSGKEIYTTSGDKSVVYGGAHTWEEGTHYVAVHDVTGSKPNVTLDYLHMDKYDVVDQDVHVVGNGGCSTITFQGNGFDELESVILTNGAYTITSSKIGHERDATTSVMFDFKDAPLGLYTAEFIFKEGTKTVNNCLSVEEAEDININGKVTFASQYLKSTYNTYTLSIKNTSNMTAYEVPIAVYIYTQNLDDLHGVKIDGHSMEEQRRNSCPQLFTPKFEDEIKDFTSKSGDLCFFTTRENQTHVSGFPSLHKTIMSVNLRPNTTETYRVSIKADSTAYVYVWWPNEWDILESSNTHKAPRRRSAVSDGICAIVNRKAQQCEDNEWVNSRGVNISGPYDVDCNNIGPSDGCPPDDGDGGPSDPVNSLDPNDIYGYLAESGSKFMADSIVTVPYRIEFENDTTFATASAHTVIVTDTLDAAKFDLASYQPTSIKIGDKDVLLKGDKEFVTTIDMRPAINAIAQVEGMYDEKNGIATWTFTSLDPMTMEPTDDVMQGFLPVNYDGLSGIGEVAFNINRKAGLADGTEIDNRASIVFDSNDAIMTPTWTNIIDAVSPTSHVTGTEMLASDSVRIHFEGADERSGVWKYTLYAQYGEGTSWEKVAETDTTCVDFKLYDGLDYGFCVLATDSAGNVEQKELVREYGLKSYLPGDANSDGKVDMKDAILILNYYVGVPGTYLNASAADVNGDGAVDVKDAIWVADHYVHDVNEVKMLKLMMKRKRTLVL